MSEETKNESVDEGVVTTTKNPKVAFSAEQLAVVGSMIEQAVKSSSGDGSKAISVYGQRDPKSIDTVNVSRYDGKFVIGFKNVQNDPLKKESLYVIYKYDPIRKLDNVPYVTLILSDGEKTEEKEVRLIDYATQRPNRFQAKVVEQKVEEVIVNHGMLGRGGGLAREIDNNGKPIIRSNIKAESMKEVRTFYVELPGFKEPVRFIDEPHGPLA